MTTHTAPSLPTALTAAQSAPPGGVVAGESGIGREAQDKMALGSTSAVVGAVAGKGSDSILHHLGNAYFEVAAAFERHMGMSRARWAILNRLSLDGSLTQTMLAQVLHVDAAAITRQVKQLEAEGLITRWAAPEDNRFTLVGLTDQGHDFVNTQRSVREEFERIATNGLSAEEIATTRRCLTHIRRNVELFLQEGSEPQATKAL